MTRFRSFPVLSLRPALLLLLAAAIVAPLRLAAEEEPAAPRGLAARLGERVEAPAPAPEPVARPYLWRLEGSGDTPHFLYGTVHVSDPRVTTLPPVVSAALDAAGALYTEIPMDMASQMAVATRIQNPALPPLAERFDPEVLEDLRAALAERNLPAEMFASMTFTGVFLTLSAIDMMGEITRYGEPLDMRLAGLAGKAGKTTGGLEELDHQALVLEGLTREQENQLLAELIENLPKGREMYGRMLDVYLAGDEAGMLDLMFEQWDPDDATDVELMDRLLYRRNRVMADRMVELIAAAPDTTHFFAVGAAHYPGEGGVLELLAARGYEITRLVAGDDLHTGGTPWAPDEAEDDDEAEEAEEPAAATVAP